MEEDIDLLIGKKLAPKQGRRSNDNNLMGIDNVSEESLSEQNSSHLEDPNLPQTRKTGVWSDEKLGNKNINKSGTNLIELERFQTKEKPDDNDDIPVIPDIDDLQDEALNYSDVKPIITVDKSTLNELNTELDAIKKDKMNLGNLGNIDLSFLTNKLYPEKDVQPRNEIWTMESIFNDLSRNS